MHEMLRLSRHLWLHCGWVLCSWSQFGNGLHLKWNLALFVYLAYIHHIKDRCNCYVMFQMLLSMNLTTKGILELKNKYIAHVASHYQGAKRNGSWIHYAKRTINFCSRGSASVPCWTACANVCCLDYSYVYGFGKILPLALANLKGARTYTLGSQIHKEHPDSESATLQIIEGCHTEHMCITTEHI